MTDQVTVLAVDDQPANLRLLDAVLSPRGYRVIRASSGEQALELVPSSGVDLVLLDIVMPGIDGYEVCRRIRSAPETAFLPVVMVTASGDQEKIRAIEAGADDFVSKPFDQSELLARVASLARVKRYHDTITEQAAELAQWNAELEARVNTQLEDLQRMNRLRRFLSPQVAELVINSGDDSVLGSHRREIVVVFCDLRGFTSFAESSEPEEVMGVLSEYHKALGELIFRYEGTLERFTGDGLMVFFNDRSRSTSPPNVRWRWRWQCAIGCGRSPRAGAESAMISASVSASLRASPPWVVSATRGGSTMRRSGASPT
jgi:adenylate cyclase